jgi:hypothetical protein
MSRKKSNKKQKKKRKINKEVLSPSAMYIGLSNTRSTEARLRWVGAQFVFFISVPTLITAWYSVFASNLSVMISVLLIVGSSVAATIHLVWYRILVRNGQYLDHWNK